ncbi:MAG: nicotinamide-nucleotide amidohydrolase family protein [Paludibacteraceae bacterium]|nr:nicotinamide-nucleotide amidohydrolase family protein [Paludibacteraceae bacterium]
MKQVEIITIGDELLIGQVVDTNSAWMAQRLNAWGYEVVQVTSVHDDSEQIMRALRDAETRADVVLLTGGLGPTKDDITKHTLCEYFGTELVYRDDILAHLERLYANRPQVLNRLTDTQCLFPANATMIPNEVGSAQVMAWKGEKMVVSMPGVPYEMMWCMEHGVGEALRAANAAAGRIVHKTVQVYGIPESSLALLIEPWESALPENMHLAYLPKDGVIRLRLSGYDVEEREVSQQIEGLLKTLQRKEAESTPSPQAVPSPCLRGRVESPVSGEELFKGGFVFATEDLPVEVLVGRALTKRGLTIGTAESCTGGKIAALLNKHAGSSAFYKGSVVSYANSVKEQVLGVRAADLEQYGAVSEPVVRQMAEGARRVLGTDYAVATSGVAGPDGGTEEKPVGTVWIAVATPEGTEAKCFSLGKLREQVTDRAAQAALIWVMKTLSGSPC